MQNRERERESLPASGGRVNGAQKLRNKNLLNFSQKIFFVCLLVFIFGLGFSAKASAAIAVVQSAKNSGNGSSVVVGSGQGWSSSGAGHLIIVSIFANSQNNTKAFSDNLGSSYTLAATAYNSQGSPAISVYYLNNSPSGITSFTLSTDYTDGVINVSEFSGIDTASPLDQVQTNGQAYSSANPFTWDTGVTGTTAQANELVYVFIGQQYNLTGPVWETTTGYTLLGTTTSTSLAEYKVVSSVGTQQATGTLTTSSTGSRWINAIVTFKDDSPPDSTAPTITAFTLPTTATSLTVDVSAFTASDAVGVTGYMLTESATAPIAGDAGWTGSAPATYTFATEGAKTLYAWAKDAAGNVSSSTTDIVNITLPPDSTAPTITAFTLPTTADPDALTVSISSFTATDNIGVTGYKLTESATSPLAGDAGWTSSAPSSYTFASAGDKTLYAWAKDLAGNISGSLSDTITIPVTPSQFANLTSCTLSGNPNSLSSTCVNTLGQDIPMPTLYDGTSNTQYDSAFGAKYFRISVPEGVTGSPTKMYPVYAKTSAWNSDGSKLLVLSNAGYYHLFDGNTYQWIRRLEHPANYVSDGLDVEPRWSQTDPDIFYYRAGMSIYQYSVTSNSSSVVRTFTNGELGTTGCVSIGTGEEGNPSDDSRYWGFWCQNGSPTWAQQGYFIYDKQADSVLSSKLLTVGGICGVDACPSTANWVGMSHSGNNFIIQWNTSANIPRTQAQSGKGTEAYDRNLNWVSQLSEAYNHADLAQMADGTDVYVGSADQNQTNGYSASRAVRLSDGAVMKTCMFPQYPLATHVSGRTNSSLVKGWVLYSSYNQAGTGMGSSLLNEEIWAQNIDTCQIKRIAHTQSNWVDTDYYSEPHAVMNFDFTKVLWGSNWRIQGSSVQAYVADLVSDTTSPTVTAFTIPATATSLTVSISTFTATDAVGVTGYLITESASAPASGDAGWSGTAQTEYIFATEGAKTLYAWTKDAAGNVSASLNDSVTITLPTYTIGGAISGMNGAVVLQNNLGDNLSVSANGSFTFVTAMNNSANYAVTVLTQPTGETCTVTNGSGTVSSANITNVSVSCADTAAPTISAFTIPSTASSLTVSISTFTATDNVGVADYLLNESATTPAVGDSNWSVSAPTTYTFLSAGSKTLYAWAKDVAGNVSASLNDSVTITLPASTKAITAFDFNGLNPAVIGTINEGNYTIALTVPYGTDITALVPTITTSGSSISPNTGVAQNFTNPVAYIVTAEDASTQEYVVTVAVAADNEPPAIPDDSDDDEEDYDNLDISKVKYSIIDNNQVKITFQTNNNAKGTARFGTDKNLKQKEKENKNKKKHTIKLKNLTPGAKYYFRISADDKHDQSERTKIYSVTLPKTTSGLSATKPRPGSGQSAGKPEVAVPTNQNQENQTPTPQNSSQNQTDRNTDNNTDTTVNDSPVSQSQPQPQKSSFKWYNPFTWF